MSTAFALTLSYLGEACSATDTAGAFAAYITGNVASNLFGRLMSASLADHFGLAANFHVFAALNLAGAVLTKRAVRRPLRVTSDTRLPGAIGVWPASVVRVMSDITQSEPT